MRTALIALLLTVVACAPQPAQNSVEQPGSQDTAAIDPPPIIEPTATVVQTAPPAPDPVPAMAAPPPPEPPRMVRARPPRMAAPIREAQMKDYVKVPVFYSTTRKLDGENRKNVYGAERGKPQYGVSWVGIPRTHKAGELEEPSIFTLTFREDPKRHVVLLEVKGAPKNIWYGNLAATIADAGTNQAFVFIHGYNVTFSDASRRAAQIKYDLGFAGPAILFSWPSHGREALYLADEANAEWSAPQLADFLVELRRRTGSTTIHLIAHSLGNRVLSRAMERIDLDPSITPKPSFSQVMLAAPDMDADVFREQLAPRMVKLARGITLYGSSDDRAILASKKAHQTARAGEGGEHLPVVDGVDSIDVSGLDASFLAHSYVGGVSVLGDIAQLLCEGKKAPERQGIVKRAIGGFRLALSGVAPNLSRATPCRTTTPLG